MDFPQLNTVLNRFSSILVVFLQYSCIRNWGSLWQSLRVIALSLKYKVFIPFTMIKEKHFFRYLTNLHHNSIVLSLPTENWISTFNYQSSDISATFAQSFSIDTIWRFFPLNSFHRSSFSFGFHQSLNFYCLRKK